MKASRMKSFKETFDNKVVVPESLKAFVIGTITISLCMDIKAEKEQNK